MTPARDLTDEQEALERFERARIIAELQRRRPDEDWRKDPPCPNCGSMDHFEC